MKWTKLETGKENGIEIKTILVYDDIKSAISDYMCPICCENCVLKGDEVTGKICNFDYAEKHEQEVANLIGLKPYEDNPGEKSLLDWTLKEVSDIAEQECEKNKSNCNKCKIFCICCENPISWKENIKRIENRERILGSSELEYLKWAYRLGYEYITCDTKNGVYLHKKMPTWLMAYDMFDITEGSEKSEFAFTIGQGEHWEISKLLEENKNV